MSFTARVENDTIKLPPGIHLPDGTEVTVEPSEKRAALKAAADAYAALLASHKREADGIAEWEVAPLAEAPRRRRK